MYVLAVEACGLHTGRLATRREHDAVDDLGPGPDVIEVNDVEHA